MNLVAMKSIVGCTPSEPCQVQAVRDKIGHWDTDERPPIADYTSLKKWVADQPDVIHPWWEWDNASALFVHSQGNLGSCAGFALANARMVRLIHQTIAWSEQKLELVNPFVTWCKSKNGGIRGGQTITEMVLAANKYGCYPVRLVGEYRDTLRWSKEWDSERIVTVAKECQVGVSEIPYQGTELADEIVFLCSKGHSVIFGATSCVNADGSVSMCGGHAQAYGGYDTKTGQIGYLNSWGDIYEDDKLPRFARRIDQEQLVRMCANSWDCYVITYAESPYDEAVTPTLEVV